jgi:putative tricarboxylic transport membrane protein
MSLIVALLLGWAAGLFTGLLPGIGATVLLISIYPFLLNFDLLYLFIFYATLLTTSQYFGSVAGIVYGIAGEITSVPSVKHGHKLFLEGQGAELLASTATGSFFASIIGLVILYVLGNNLEILLLAFDNSVKTVYLALAIAVLVAVSKNKIQSVLLAVLGVVVGLIGYQSVFRIHFAVSPGSVMDNGIAFMPLFLGFIVIPALWSYLNRASFSPAMCVDSTQFRVHDRVQNLFSSMHLNSMARGSVVGTLAGMIPGVSYAISSNLAAALEQKIKQPMQNFRTVVSAESANNSGVISVLIPLIFLAMPIVPSESVIMSVAELQGFGYTVSFDFIRQYLWHFIAVLFLVSVANWVVAGYFYTVVTRLYGYLKNTVYIILISALILILVIVSWYANHLFLSMLVFFISLVFGTMIKHEDSKMVFVFAFFLSDQIVSEFYRFYIFHFT